MVMDLLPQSCQPISICVGLCHSWGHMSKGFFAVALQTDGSITSPIHYDAAQRERGCYQMKGILARRHGERQTDIQRYGHKAAADADGNEDIAQKMEIIILWPFFFILNNK